jgi:hypothetical protein
VERSAVQRSPLGNVRQMQLPWCYPRDGLLNNDPLRRDEPRHSIFQPAHFIPVNIISAAHQPAGGKPLYPRGMSVFLLQVSKAARTANDAKDRRWIYVPYDRVTDRAGPLHNISPTQCGIVMVESSEKGMRRSYHIGTSPGERKALRERTRVAIEELARVPRPDYESAGKR